MIKIGKVYRINDVQIFTVVSELLVLKISYMYSFSFSC